MIPIEILRRVKRILTHKSCPDGMSSAMTLHDCLPDAEIIFCQYGSSELAALEPRSGDLWVDFSPPRDRFEEWLPPNVEGTIILDHHATAKDVVSRFGDLGVYSDEPGVSGAVLAYREVWAPLNLNSFDWTQFSLSPSWNAIQGIYLTTEHATYLRYFAFIAGTRDTWQTSSPRWQESCEQAEALRFWPADYLLSLKPDRWAGAMEIGRILVQKNRERDGRTIDGAYRFRVGPTEVVCFQGLNTSDIVERFSSEDVVVVGWTYYVDNKKQRMQVSMRASASSSVDVSAIAKKYGGGGHKKAAGFVVDAPEGQNPYEFLYMVLS